MPSIAVSQTFKIALGLLLFAVLVIMVIVAGA